MASACQLPVASSSSHLKSYINFHRVTSPHCTFRLSSPWSLHDTDNILVGNYAQELAKPGAVKWRNRVSFLPSFPKNKSRDDVKQELLKAIALLDRGAEATSEDQERVDQIARELEALNPTTEPLKSNLLNGKWELLYTTSRSILQPQRPKILRPFGKIYQAINADTLRAQNIETWPYFNQVTANLVPLNERRVAVRFDRFKIGGLVFFESTRKEMLERRKRPRPPMPIGQNSSPKFEKVRKKFEEDKTSAPLEASIENKALSPSNVTTLNNIPSLVEILAQEVREKSPHVENMVEIDDEEPGDLANPLFPLVVRDLVDQIPKLVLPTVPLVGSNLVLEGWSDQASDNIFESPPRVLVKRKILIVVFRVTGILPPSTGIPANNNILGFDLGVMLRSPSEFHSLDGSSMTIAADA